MLDQVKYPQTPVDNLLHQLKFDKKQRPKSQHHNHQKSNSSDKSKKDKSLLRLAKTINSKQEKIKNYSVYLKDLTPKQRTKHASLSPTKILNKLYSKTPNKPSTHSKLHQPQYFENYFTYKEKQKTPLK